MECKRFGLGIRFDIIFDASVESVVRQIMDELCSVLTLSDLKGLRIRGGFVPCDHPSESRIFMLVIDGGSLKEMRRIYRKLDGDAGINMYLASTNPYYENNRLEGVDELMLFGVVDGRGRITGGDAEAYTAGVVVPTSHGRKRPVGKGIKIMLAPDSFKSSMSSMDAIKRLTVAARRNFPGVKIVPVPIADGGEGTLNAITTACNAAIRSMTVSDPLGRRTKAEYGVLYGRRAIIEMAQASGLTLVAPDERDIMRASSFGTGELIRRALDEGITDIVVAIGGSATNDGGMGCAKALGVKFFDADGCELEGCAADLERVASIDCELLHPSAKNATFTIMCDVDNPLLGETGCARVYAAQKGASAEQIEALERGMANFAVKLNEYCGADVSELEGAGAAGGMGAMFGSLFGAKLVRGIDALLDTIDFDLLLDGVAMVVTGEGRLDSQTTRHKKAVYGIVRRCNRRNIPVCVITGSMGEGAEELYDLCNVGIMTAVNCQMSESAAMENALKLFDSAADRMFRLIRIGRDVEKIGAPKKPKYFDEL
ncbi:MAG: glycerate kinase [Clostridia bacterium]|nr:glycerate kinase [Clostridia bacterium]